MMHVVRTFTSMRAYVRLTVIEDFRNHGKIVFIENIVEKGGEGNAYPSSHPPGSSPSHKLQKPSKESGIFQSLGTISSFLLKGKK